MVRRDFFKRLAALAAAAVVAPLAKPVGRLIPPPNGAKPYRFPYTIYGAGTTRVPLRVKGTTNIGCVLDVEITRFDNSV